MRKPAAPITKEELFLRNLIAGVWGKLYVGRGIRFARKRKHSEGLKANVVGITHHPTFRKGGGFLFVVEFEGRIYSHITIGPVFFKRYQENITKFNADSKNSVKCHFPKTKAMASVDLQMESLRADGKSVWTTMGDCCPLVIRMLGRVYTGKREFVSQYSECLEWIQKSIGILTPDEEKQLVRYGETLITSNAPKVGVVPGISSAAYERAVEVARKMQKINNQKRRQERRRKKAMKMMEEKPKKKKKSNKRKTSRSAMCKRAADRGPKKLKSDPVALSRCPSSRQAIATKGTSIAASNCMHKYPSFGVKYESQTQDLANRVLSAISIPMTDAMPVMELTYDEIMALYPRTQLMATMRVHLREAVRRAHLKQPRVFGNRGEYVDYASMFAQ